MSEPTKYCRTCNTSKPLEEFHRNKGKSLGRSVRCKDCQREYHRQYYEANREKILARTGAYQAADPVRSRDYSRKYHAANREKRRAYSAQYRDEDPERNLAQQRAFRERHPEKHRRDAHARRAAMAKVEHDPRVTLESLRDRDGDFCCYCGMHLDFECGQYVSNRATLEHVTPISRGGAHTFDNTAIACRACNLSKYNATLLFEWVSRRT